MADIIATVRRVQQLANSANGNRRFLISTSAGTFTTAKDHAFVQTISWDSLLGKRVRLELSGRNALVSNLEVLGFDHENPLP